MPTRHDVSRVPLQGGYIAKQCPVRIQWDIIEPGPRAEPTAVMRLRFDAGNEFEAALADSFVADEAGGWLAIPEGERAEMIRATVEAMERRAPVVFGGWLPADHEGRRTGKPDLLVFAGDGYVPVDVKHHLTLEASEDGGALVSELSDPSPTAAAIDADWGLRKHRGDALQLAHYRRLLQACGFGSESPLGGIIGKELRIAWYDLDERLWRTPAKSNPKRKTAMRSSMAIYDFEFDFRLDIAAVAQGHREDSPELLVVPLNSAECAECDWRNHCGPIIRHGDGDPSLLPGIDFYKWHLLRENRITDRAGVARLDHFTARLAAEGVDVEKVLRLAAEADSQTPVATLIPAARKQISLLEAAGILTAGDVVDRLDALTARVAGSSAIARAILEARAILGPEPVYRLGDEVPPLSRFDIELDVDMENGIDGFVYLWGVWVTDRTATGLVPQGYVPFSSWEALDKDSEFEVFARFWAWLTDLRQHAAAAGHTLGAFYWSEAETNQMRRIAREMTLDSALGEFIGSDGWVDLLPIFREGWITGEGAGLKTAAAAIGFEWDVDDPGGADSMVIHRNAVAGDEEARHWLLEYNRGDVEATRAVREWMVGPGTNVPELDASRDWSHDR